MNKFNKKEELNYTESHKSKNYGLKYDKGIYAKNTYDDSLWIIEKLILSKFFNSNSKNLKFLDFACGTGRITKFIEKYDFKEIWGFDVSDSMLKVAENKLDKTKLINIDINNDNIENYFNYFDIVTAFRFFLNAENELRKKTFFNLNKIIKKDAYLIFNIHGNKKSIRFFYVIFHNFVRGFIYFILNKKKNIFTYKKQISNNEIINLLEKNNFKVEKVFSYSFLTKLIYYILPNKLFIKIEKKMISNKFLFGTHLIYICKKIK